MAGDGVTAIVQRDAWWLIAMEMVGLVFALLLFAGGVIGIKPSLMDTALEAIEPWVMKWWRVLRG